MIYADCNAVSPDTARAVAGSLAGVGFVDIGIIGGPPQPDDAVPRFYASGDGVAALQSLADRGIDLRPIDGGIGAASAPKMSYAGITKGLTALRCVMALAAARHHLSDNPTPPPLAVAASHAPDWPRAAVRVIPAPVSIWDWLSTEPTLFTNAGRRAEYSCAAIG